MLPASSPWAAAPTRSTVSTSPPSAIEDKRAAEETCILILLGTKACQAAGANVWCDRTTCPQGKSNTTESSWEQLPPWHSRLLPGHLGIAELELPEPLRVCSGQVVSVLDTGMGQRQEQQTAQQSTVLPWDFDGATMSKPECLCRISTGRTRPISMSGKDDTSCTCYCSPCRLLQRLHAATDADH